MPSVLRLDVLNARHGDCLMLHYGTTRSPHGLLVDGGPGGTYEEALRPYLVDLAAERRDQRFDIELAMLSHIDDDHVNGLIDLLKEIGAGGDVPVRIGELWHNSFDDIVGGDADDDELLTELIRSATPNLSADGSVVESVPQGRTLRELARQLGLPVNATLGPLLMASPSGATTARLLGGLKVTVVAPSQVRLNALREEWKRVVEKQADETFALARAALDESIFNLSSIVVLLEANGRKLLLTGDARADDILIGLTSAGVLRRGRLHVDVLKLPHHGSDRNVNTEFFRRVTADNYVVSGDGSHDNPEVSTITMLAEARGNEPYTLYLTNRERRLRSALRARQGRRVVHRAKRSLAVSIDLLAP